MEIVMKGCGLKNFQNKDVYTWNEILDVIDDLENQIDVLNEKIEMLQENEEDYDPYN